MPSEFTFKSWSFDSQSGQLDLYYHDSKYGDFCEQYYFPKFENEVIAQQYNRRKNNIDRAFEQLFWMVGVSYYKTQLANEFQFEDHH